MLMLFSVAKPGEMEGLEMQTAALRSYPPVITLVLLRRPAHKQESDGWEPTNDRVEGALGR